MKKSSLRPSCPINGLNHSQDIADLFAAKYKDLYNSVPPDPNCMDRIIKSMQASLDTCDIQQTFISYECVKAAISKLKHEKSDGESGYISSHLMYASDMYHKEIAKMLTSMFVHGYHPDLLVSATIISIPKDLKGNLASDTNYRGIALSSSISKVFDIIFMTRNSDLLHTSQLQFAFKPKHSTTMCTTVLKEVLRHYRINKSDVYSCLLDASKAFDLIKHDKLFQLLQDRKIPALDLRMIINQYKCQKIITFWQDYCSDYFIAHNGIRQGSIASPILFNVHMDELLHKLESSGIGCWVGNRYYGVIAYADDVTLISPTVNGLQKMLTICEQFGKEYHMQFNTLKTVSIKFGSKKPDNKVVKLSGNELHWQTHAKHLGVYLAASMDEQMEITRKKGDFIGRVRA